MSSWPLTSAIFAVYVSAFLASATSPVAAQSRGAGQQGTSAPAQTAGPDPALIPSPTEPDFTLAALPTNLRLPRHKLAFRLTTRFSRSLTDGAFADLASDLFGFDSIPRLGLELRYGVISRGQIGVYRTSNRTVEMFGQYQFVHQAGFPLSVSAVVSVDGKDNFSERFSPGVQLVISREVGDRLALYVEPGFVNNTNDGDSRSREDRTMQAGVGARLRILASAYVVVEGTPRFSGYAPGRPLVSVGLEKRSGSHVLQLNVSNSPATTPSQIARGTLINADDWFVGVNLSRKFY